jgi:hypothetical protein
MRNPMGVSVRSRVPVTLAFVLAAMAAAGAGHEIGGRQRTFTFRKIAKQKHVGLALMTSHHDVPRASLGLDRHGELLSVGG